MARAEWLNFWALPAHATAAQSSASGPIIARIGANIRPRPADIAPHNSRLAPGLSRIYGPSRRAAIRLGLSPIDDARDVLYRTPRGRRD